jgi:hypothetical protein
MVRMARQSPLQLDGLVCWQEDSARLFRQSMGRRRYYYGKHQINRIALYTSQNMAIYCLNLGDKKQDYTPLWPVT